VELRQKYDRIVAEGFQVIAISPDTPDNSRQTKARYRLPFAVLSDSPMEAATAFGITWRVTDRDDDYYAKLQRASGETHRLLPVPAYFIVDTAGLIWFEYVNPNYRVRPPFELMLAGVQAVITMWNTKAE
jgi:peroxiredoxin